MKKRSVLLMFSVLAIVVVVAQLNLGIFQFAQANLKDMDDLYGFVQQEIIDIPREVFDTWEVFYLDVTSDGVDEAVLVSPYGQHWHPHMEIIRVDGRKFQRIVSEIPLGKNGSSPEIKDNFLTVTSTTSGTGLLDTYLDIYIYDGTKVLPSLLTLTLFRQEAARYHVEEVTGELNGPLTDFTHTLMNIDPLSSTPVIVKGAYHYSFDPGTLSYAMEQLAVANQPPTAVFDQARINQTYQRDLDGNGIPDIFRLEAEEEPGFVINGEVYHLPELLGSSIHPYYELTRIEHGDSYAFVLYLSSPLLETSEMYFYEYKKDGGLSLMGKIYSEESLYDLPILSLYNDRAAINYMVYPFFDGVHRQPWHVNSDVQWMAENTCVNIDGRFNLQGFTMETVGENTIVYDNYVGVIIPMYTGVNKDLLTEQKFVLGTDRGQSLSFAIFGTMHETEVFYYETFNPEVTPVTKKLGTLENSLVTLNTHLPWDSSYIRVTGIVMGGEGHENYLAFNLDDMRDWDDYDPIFISY